jgi:acyl phosphate:glycerol-3-phosphate acyltransferase
MLPARLVSRSSFLVSRKWRERVLEERETRNEKRSLSTYAIIAVVSYLLGSIPFGYILVKLFLKQDIRATGSGNIGATNVGRTGHKGLAIATLLLDAGKGSLSVFIAYSLIWKTGFVLGGREVLIPISPQSDIMNLFREREMVAASLAAFCAILGHMFPVWLRFKGGKGVATAAGAFFLIAPIELAIALVLFAAVAGIFRYVSLASIVAAAAFPIAVAFMSGYRYFIVPLSFVIACALLIILKHYANIRRLLAGTENKLGAKKPAIPPPQEMEKQA